ncbi:MAG: pyruvate ferredoxin oxidoreductase [Candidatus Heimdallarchaeota archaeon]|nr:pyruvate ferredoxin oxidoreductase [Candidatus Heimdallarchaeota archaeon]MCK4769428.1 pyruvate ferredoxin oxidoreductase [Candidatus Heimdallarchaeota archaeon]
MIPDTSFTDMITANKAVAIAVVRAKPKVIAAYPICPQTEIVEYVAEFVSQGDLNAEYVRVESENSAITIVAAAEGTGVRTFTATASQGLANMHEVVAAAGGMRLPIVMFVANRTLMSPGGIWPEYSDSMPERDSCWMQVYVQNNQEAFDMIIQAYKIAEDSRILLPIMICGDGYTLTHTTDTVDIPSEKEVDEFLPPYVAKHAFLDIENPIAQGVIVPPSYHMEAKWQMHQAMKKAKEVIKEVNDDFASKFGRDYGGLIRQYKMEDAEYALVVTGSTSSTARVVVDELRSKGEKVGLVILRFFRPFPVTEIQEALKDIKSAGIFDRSISYGSTGQCFIEVRNALYGTSTPLINLIAGLGGRDITEKDISFMFDKIKENETVKVKEPVIFVNTRGVTV